MLRGENFRRCFTLSMRPLATLSRHLFINFNKTMRNVEIKAKVRDIEVLKSKAKLLSKSGEGIVIKQHDTFFKSTTGRLKLRQFENGSGELIHYERPDTEGPKLSNYAKTSIAKDEIQGLTEVLQKSNGIVGIVKKTRLLYIVDQTRVHVDSVDGLGDFMELEVVLNEEQSVQDGQEIADQLMAELGVEKEDLIAGAYLDMIKVNSSNGL